MSSPSMHHYAGYEQARLDCLRSDAFALVNFRHMVRHASFIQGYEEYVWKAYEDPTHEHHTLVSECLEAATGGSVG